MDPADTTNKYASKQSFFVAVGDDFDFDGLAIATGWSKFDYIDKLFDDFFWNWFVAKTTIGVTFFHDLNEFGFFV